VLNVVKLFALCEPSEHPHGASIAIRQPVHTDKPVIFKLPRAIRG